jgi:hypothetical protein
MIISIVPVVETRAGRIGIHNAMPTWSDAAGQDEPMKAAPSLAASGEIT